MRSPEKPKMRYSPIDLAKERKAPKIFVKDIFGKVFFDYNNVVYSVLGVKGAGKSATLEVIATRYPKVLDLGSSIDGENLAWLRSGMVKNPLLICSDNVRLKTSFDWKKISEVRLKDILEHDFIISTPAFYMKPYEIGRPEEEFQAIQRIIAVLWQRKVIDEYWYLLFREAPNYFYSRIGLGVDEQTAAKKKFIEVARESRHFGLALGLDMLRYTAVEIDLRELSDYIIFKALGPTKLDERLRWIFAFVNPYFLRDLPKPYAVIEHEGNIAVAYFEYPKWHKKVEEGVSIFESLGIEIVHEVEGAVDMEKVEKVARSEAGEISEKTEEAIEEESEIKEEIKVEPDKVEKFPDNRFDSKDLENLDSIIKFLNRAGFRSKTDKSDSD